MKNEQKYHKLESERAELETKNKIEELLSKKENLENENKKLKGRGSLKTMQVQLEKYTQDLNLQQELNKELKDTVLELH